MREEFLEELLVRKGELEGELAEVDALLRRHKVIPPRPEIRMIHQTKHPRVRGVFKAAKKAVESFSEPFDKNQLRDKLVEIDQGFANKITAANIRNTLRLLKINGIIRVETAASATKRATYVRAA